MAKLAAKVLSRLLFERIAVARRELGGALADGFDAGFRSGSGSPFLSAISFGETKEMAPSAARKRPENGVREADTARWVTPHSLAPLRLPRSVSIGG